MRDPLFDVEIPVLAHPAAERDKGAGIAMCCTFGDLTDVQWWRELQLPTRPVITRDGRLARETPGWITSSAGQRRWVDLAGKTAFSARAAVVELLRETGDLDGEPTPTQRMANFYEKGDKPLEIVTTRQWYIRNGGRNEGAGEGLREQLLARGEELDFHPEFMRVRYENWVGGLNGDWLISRQRFFGVADPGVVPARRGRRAGLRHADRPRRERAAGRPAAATCPPGTPPTSAACRAASSATPTSWTPGRPARSRRRSPAAGAGTTGPVRRVFPMDLRPQGQDIIRTWLFSTVVRSHLEEGSLPWKHAAISGWILDPDRKKMSKSKGNVVTPMGLLEQHGSDAVRYWAASARLGTDAAFDEGQMKIGRRLAIKVLNASKFALGFGEVSARRPRSPSPWTWPCSRGWRRWSTPPPPRCEGYDHTRALETTETFFWTFCDDYLELVKDRAYGTEGVDPAATASARLALATALDTLLRLLAPVIPFATEEVWSWWREGSVHRAPWPTSAPLREIAGDADPTTLDAAGRALAALRKVKSEAKVSMRTPIVAGTLIVPTGQQSRVELAWADVLAAGRAQVELSEGELDVATVEGAELGVAPPR